MDITNLFEKFKDTAARRALYRKVKRCSNGDIMLDTYWWGHVERISPEAPVPVVTLDRREYRIGGAGNVALNLASLGAQVATFSFLGEDEDGKTLQRLLQDHQIDTSYLLKGVLYPVLRPVQSPDHGTQPADAATRLGDDPGRFPFDGRGVINCCRGCNGTWSRSSRG